MPCTDSQSTFQSRQITRFQRPLKNYKTPFPPNLLKYWFVIVLKDQTPNEQRNLRKRFRRRLRLVSIQRPRAKRPEEKGIQDKMRIRGGLSKVKRFDIEFEVNFGIRYKVILSSVMPKVNKQRFASSWRYHQSAFFIVLV
jgi:hypothetical protein